MSLLSELNARRQAPRRRVIALAVALGLSSAASVVLAADLVGASAVVNPGDPQESWRLSAGADLTIKPGGSSLDIRSDASTVNMDGATVTDTPSSIAMSVRNSTANVANSTITGRVEFARDSAATISNSSFSVQGGSGPALRVVNSSVSLVGSSINSSFGSALSMGAELGVALANPSTVTATNTDITGIGEAVVVGGGGILTLDNSRVTGLSDPANTSLFNGMGVTVFRGEINALNGSVISGEDRGIAIYYIPDTASVPDNGVAITIDGSSVVGQTGAAVSVLSFAGAPTKVTEISVLNGATLSGGNGNLLEVTGDGGGAVNFTAGASALTGNVLVDATETANLTFQNNASLTGALTNVTSMALADTSRWNVTADSTVGSLNLGSGTLAFAAPSPGYKTVTVGGDLSVSGGTLIFNSVLAGDGAPSDKIVVGGNTSGSGNIVVNNIGGAGAQTTDGIQLISVAGNSGATFAMNGRATGGVYEYLLYKGGVTNPADGGWYLRSAYTGNPCDLNPSLPICAPVDPTDPTDPVTPVDPIIPDPTDPVPVLRPEPGAYLANQAAAIRMFQQRRHDRGEPAFEHDRIGAWARVSRDQLHTTVAGQVDARSQTNALQIGSDVVRWGQDGRGQIGVMLATGDADTQATSRITGYGTRGKVKGDAVGVYGTWVQSAEESAGLYVDGWLQYGRYDSWVQGDGLAREKYDATTRAASVEAGYGFALSNNDRRAIYLQPQVQVSYTDYKGDTLQEVNGTIVEDGNAGGLETRVGVRLFGHDNAAGNRVQPFFAVNWLYNERGDTMRFDGETLDAKLPTNRYEAQAGAQLRLGERWSAWGDLRVQRGDGGYKDAGAQMGVRRAW